MYNFFPDKLYYFIVYIIHLHRLPPFEPKDISIRVECDTSKGAATVEKLRDISPSNLLANKTWNTRTGTTRKVYATAEFRDVLLCLAFIWGVLNNTAANTIAYRTATRDRHSNAQRGTNTTSQLQVTKPSSLSARNINCKIFTAQKSSNSNDRSCFTAQIHTCKI